MPRLFTAIELPGHIKSSIHEVQKSLHSEVRKTTTENLHLTLHFIGDVSDENAEVLRAKLATVSAPKFSLSISGTGSFRAAGHRIVAWIGVHESKPLQQLHREIQTALSHSELPADNRPYSPHITIGRSKKGFRGKAFENETEVDGNFDVPAFVLFRSDLSSAAPVYSVVERYELS